MTWVLDVIVAVAAVDAELRWRQCCALSSEGHFNESDASRLPGAGL